MPPSGRRLIVAMLVLLASDVVGGFVGVATDAETWGTVWGFDTHSTVPLPMGLAQLALAWLAARDVRPRLGFVAAALLGAICLMSVLFGVFDGDLIGTVESDGFVSWGFAWGVVLLCATAVVGVLDLIRERQLRPPVSPSSRAAPATGSGDAACSSSSTRSGGCARG
jgi:hypothetical protein